MRIVTSWGPKGWDLYGKAFLASTKFWDPALDLTIYVDGVDPASIPHPKVKKLEDTEGFSQFRETHKDRNGETPDGYNYRLDAFKFCAKVFALHDAAIDPSPFLWIDADVVTKAPLTLAWLQSHCKPNVTHLGRKGINYSETGFIYFEGIPARALIADMYDIYMSGEIFNYSEWTDAFIFERVLQIHRFHGLETHNLVNPDYVGLDAFENSPLHEVFTHNKGARKTLTRIQNRYDQLLAIVSHVMPKTILETGTWDGNRAIQMAQVAFGKWDHIVYHGYDLFEEASDQTDKEEHNVKKHYSLAEVTDTLQRYADGMKTQGKIFEFHLTRGDTKNTLRELPGIDFAFLDGGHSLPTISHDWEMCKKIPTVVFDDYYVEDAEGKLPDSIYCGVKTIVDGITRDKKIYPGKDPVSGGGIVQLAAVGSSLPELAAATKGMAQIKVTAQDCMPKDHIIANVQANMKLLNKWTTKTRQHSRKLVVVSAGPDILKRQSQIRKLWKAGADIACVKHSLPTLLKWGIAPDYMVLLDPRPVEGISTHGIKRTELLDEIPPETKVLIASMSDPSVTSYVLSRTPNVWGWHAMTQALIKSDVFPPGSLLINGGTCAAWRTVSLCHTLGYEEFHLFGFDFSYPESEIDKTAKDELDRPKFMQITVGDTGKKFWSTGELIAASQDAQYFFTHTRDMGIRLYCHGEGIGPTMWRLLLGNQKQELPTLEEVFR